MKEIKQIDNLGHKNIKIEQQTKKSLLAEAQGIELIPAPWVKQEQFNL